MSQLLLHLFFAKYKIVLQPEPDQVIDKQFGWLVVYIWWGLATGKCELCTSPVEKLWKPRTNLKYPEFSPINAFWHQQLAAKKCLQLLLDLPEIGWQYVRKVHKKPLLILVTNLAGIGSVPNQPRTSYWVTLGRPNSLHVQKRCNMRSHHQWSEWCNEVDRVQANMDGNDQTNAGNLYLPDKAA